jgi:uncharacterized membrane protein YcfT
VQGLPTARQPHDNQGTPGEQTAMRPAAARGVVVVPRQPGEGGTPVVNTAAAAGPATGGGAAARPRLEWADTAKGVCILLVVLWHVIMKHYLQLDWRIGVPLPGVWGALGEQLLPLRMPLFFAISGMFAASAITRPWRDVARSRIAKFLYLYALWLLIHTAVFGAASGLPTDRATNALQLLEQLTITPSNLWYLFALALYFAIAKAGRKLPLAAMLIPALVLSGIAAADLLPVPGNRGGLYQNLIWFLCGIYFRPAIEALTAKASAGRLAAAAAAYAGALGLVGATGLQNAPGVWPALCAIATVFGFIGAAMLSRWQPVSRPLAALGRQTLPIYVIHMPVLAVLHLLLAGPLNGAGRSIQLAVAIAEPLVLTALIAWLCLLMHRGLQAAGASALFDLPARRRAAGPDGRDGAAERPGRAQAGGPARSARPDQRGT